MNFCNVRNSLGRSTEQMENQLSLMPSPVISMQIFIVEVFFLFVWEKKRSTEETIFFVNFSYLQVHKPKEVSLRSNNKSKVADCPASNKTCASGNDTTWI